MDALEEVEMEPDQIDKVYEYLEAKGIDVVGSADADIDLPPMDDEDESVELDLSVPKVSV